MPFAASYSESMFGRLKGMFRDRYDGPPVLLEAKDLPSVAKYIQSDDCKRVFVMEAKRPFVGVSTSAGIPDFRSPDTGLYANLARLNLPYPEAVFEINFFRRNPLPFYTLAHELYPGRYRPTPTHTFIKLLHDHSLLKKCFTQNIDTLERRAGVPDDVIIEAHGSFANQRCIDCGREYDDEKMRGCILRKEIPRCERKKCGGLVKPDIVFFGESLPPNFHASIGSLSSADLLIVMGTSLTVHPFASLVNLVPEECPRVLINLDHVGNFGTRSDDVVYLGKCDDAVRELCKHLGWEKELEEEWEKTKAGLEVEAKAADATLKAEKAGEGKEPVPTKAKGDESLKEEVDELTERIGASLAVSGPEAAVKTEVKPEGIDAPELSKEINAQSGDGSLEKLKEVLEEDLSANAKEGKL
ncbi:hypothetical protein JAAARDRAFT_30602 [Jaapia argillacea MUCL 33604]|uniref:Deacetylase sirtuin-type domain-containing protein n=1 Tax=Jaapia argillacea MUCL 33604 TaxID=933084 RepID=A0A067Q6M5_9AGAM|nr:hypothetical protein JAAARDRAFT_30602 [Jaapia argillacea MUCL 33604]